MHLFCWNSALQLAYILNVFLYQPYSMHVNREHQSGPPDAGIVNFFEYLNFFVIMQDAGAEGVFLMKGCSMVHV